MLVTIGLLLLRLTLGLVMAGHGAQKLFGAFGGHGMDGTTQMVEALRFRPARFWAWVVALAEFVGGLLLVLGLLTPIAAGVIIVDMVIAIAMVHWQKGFWNTQGGFEYPLVLLLLGVVLGLVGPGMFSLDALLRIDASSALIFVISLVVLLVGMLVIALLTGSVFERRLHAPQSQ